MLLITMPVVFFLALLSTLCASTPLPVSTSLVPISDWPSLFPFSVKQVLDVFDSGRTPDLPTAITIGQNKLHALISPNRKLSKEEAAARHDVLKAFWAEQYPNISFAKLKNWSQPLYQAYLSSLGLSTSIAHLGADYHRDVLLGLRAVQVLLEAGQLNHFAILDPAETRFYTGLANRRPGQIR